MARRYTKISIRRPPVICNEGAVAEMVFGSGNYEIVVDMGTADLAALEGLIRRWRHLGPAQHVQALADLDGEADVSVIVTPRPGAADAGPGAPSREGGL